MVHGYQAVAAEERHYRILHLHSKERHPEKFCTLETIFHPNMTSGGRSTDGRLICELENVASVWFSFSLKPLTTHGISGDLQPRRPPVPDTGIFITLHHYLYCLIMATRFITPWCLLPAHLGGSMCHVVPRKVSYCCSLYNQCGRSDIYYGCIAYGGGGGSLDRVVRPNALLWTLITLTA